VAQLVVEGDDLLLHLSWREKMGGFHGDIRVPLAAVRSVTAPKDVWLTMRGRRMAGIAITGVVALGTRIHGGGYDFTAIHRQRPTVQVDINGPPRWQRLIVSVDDGIDPGAEAERIAVAAGIRSGSPPLDE
jgi:hypothetical protein